MEARRLALDEGVRAEDDFERFFALEYPRLVGALYLITGHKDEAEDLAQEALARTFERWDRVRTMESPTGYVFRVAHNLHRRSLRRLRAYGRRTELVPAPLSDPALAAEAHSDVRRALRALSVRHRQVLVLTDWLEMGSDEVSRVLGIGRNAARVRLHRARRAFRQELGEPYE